MKLPAPFCYSAAPLQRRHAPAGYKNYQDYKPWLRDEFSFRCVYCLEREQWYPDRAASFSVDHAIPQVVDPSRVCDYENLLYACTRCNSARQDVEIIDPTAVPFGEHLRVRADGTIRALTREGQDLIDLLHLDKPPAVEVRQYYLEILRPKKRQPGDAKIHHVFVQAFMYPEDMPDLTKLKPPQGNRHQGSESTCYHALQAQGKLLVTY
jgi:hypothetical protein